MIGMKMRGSVTKESEMVLSFVDVSAEARADRQKRLGLTGEEIHVWAFSLRVSPQAHSRLKRWLSPEERDRAARFLLDQHRKDYVGAHGVLRYLLGRYCETAPERLEFCQAEYGKPYLVKYDGSREAVTFNLTHSHGRGLIAVSRGREVGIDLESIQDGVNHMELAERFFAASELGAIRQKPADQQRATFFRYWVCKEAVLKGQGTGLRTSLKHCALSFLAGGNSAYVAAQEAGQTEREWFVQVLPTEDGWVGAVAAEGKDWTIKYGSWNESG